MKQTGLTLIELMVTLAVLSVLLLVGVPQFNSTTSNSRLTTVINTLKGDFAFARTEAIKRATPVTVTPVSNNDWSSGWTTAVNISGGADLRLSPALSAGATITTAATSVQFNANGRSNSGTLTFTLCDNRSGTFGKRVTLNPTGQSFLAIQQSCNP